MALLACDNNSQITDHLYVLLDPGDWQTSWGLCGSRAFDSVLVVCGQK